MFLITGCGRSGTVYMSKVLNRAGLNVGHERLGVDGAVSPLWLVRDRRYPSYHQQGPRPLFDRVIHQVRHPLDTIASLTTTAPGSWKWLMKHIPLDPDSHVLTMAADFWLFWNIRAQGRAEFTYRIEDLENVWPRIKRITGAHGSYDEAVKGIPKNTNKRSHRKVGWSDVYDATSSYDHIRRLAEMYGYDV